MLDDVHKVLYAVMISFCAHRMGVGTRGGKLVKLHTQRLECFSDLVTHGRLCAGLVFFWVVGGLTRKPILTGYAVCKGHKLISGVRQKPSGYASN